MCAIPQLFSAPLNSIPNAEHFKRSHPQWSTVTDNTSDLEKITQSKIKTIIHECGMIFVRQIRFTIILCSVLKNAVRSHSESQY